MLVAGEGAAPTASHLRAIAKTLSLKQADRIIDEVQTAVGHFASHADDAGVPATLRKQVARVLSGR
jgi:hypothetical protein